MDDHAADRLPRARTARPAAPTSRRSSLRLQPPRSPEAEARAWPIEVVARLARARSGCRRGARRAHARALRRARERAAPRASRRPARRGLRDRRAQRRQRAGRDRRRRARQRERLPLRLRQAAAERRRRAGATARRSACEPPKQMIFGRTKERRFAVNAQARRRRGRGPPAARRLRQRPWIPAWVLPHRPDPDRAGIAFWALRPNTTKVPDLAGPDALRRRSRSSTTPGSSSASRSRRPTTKARPARSQQRFPRRARRSTRARK